MIDVGDQFAAAGGLAVEGRNRPKPLESSSVGKRRIDDAVNVEVAGRLFAAEAAHRQDDVGLVQGAVDQNRLAQPVGGQVGKLAAIIGVVGRQRYPLPQGGREQLAGIATAGAAAGLAFEHRDSVGIDTGFDQCVDHRRGDCGLLGEAAIEGDHHPITGRRALCEGGIVDWLAECGDGGRRKIGQRLPPRHA